HSGASLPGWPHANSAMRRKGMRLHTGRNNWTGGTKAAGRSIAHTGKRGLRERTFAMSFEVAKDISKNQEPVLSQEIPEFLIASGWLMSRPEQRLPDHSEIKAATGIMASPGVIPEGLFADKV